MTADRPPPLRLLVVDDHAVVRAGLCSLLGDEPDLRVVAEADSGREAVRQARALEPDVVVLDVRMGSDDGDSSGIEACREIKAALPDTRVIMFTSFGERESVLAAVMAGADGFLTKTVSRGKLLEAIRAVGQGESILDSHVTRDVIDRLAGLSRAPARQGDTLSEREKEVLGLITEGYTNKEIAAALVLSPFTARNHVTHILEKLGVSRRSEAAAQAVYLGLVGRD